MMARNTNVPFKGRIQKRKTYHLQIIIFGLQRAAGPYKRATSGREQLQQILAPEGAVSAPLLGEVGHRPRL
jgi:hypothetical protein